MAIIESKHTLQGFKVLVTFDDTYEIMKETKEIDPSSIKNPLKIYTEAVNLKKLKVGDIKYKKVEGIEIYKLIVFDFDKKNYLNKRNLSSMLKKCLCKIKKDGHKDIAIIPPKRSCSLDEKLLKRNILRILKRDKKLDEGLERIILLD